MRLNKIHLVIVIVLFCAVAVWCQMNLSDDNSTAEIVSDGKVIDTIDLSKVKEPYEFEVRNKLGHNKVRVEQGRIAVMEADCPDKVCVNQGYIGNGGLPIVCLPHKLTITMKGGGEFDAVAGR